MVEYSYADIAQWVIGHFAVRSKRGDELSFPCPICDHDSCYFNIRKRMGFCHRASCHTVFDMDKMTDIIGYSPELAGYVPALDKKKKPTKPVTLPKGAEPIVNGLEVEALIMRGVSEAMIHKFRIHTNDTHIIVPIYDEGVLVQYNSRRVNKNAPISQWFSAIPSDALRYKYAPDIPITNFILGWEECKLWESLVLVENTFVSMWLRDLGVTTNFGSYLSDTQINKIVHSNVKHVTFLWDEGANAQRAERALKKVGVPSRVIYIKGQPDDHTKDEIKELLK